MHSKTIPMTLEHAVSIANDMLDVLQAFIEIRPIQLSNSVENGQTKFKTYKFHPDGKISFGLNYGPK